MAAGEGTLHNRESCQPGGRRTGRVATVWSHPPWVRRRDLSGGEHLGWGVTQAYGAIAEAPK